MVEQAMQVSVANQAQEAAAANRQPVLSHDSPELAPGFLQCWAEQWWPQEMLQEGEVQWMPQEIGPVAQWLPQYQA